MAVVGIKLELATSNLPELRKIASELFDKPGNAAILEAALAKALTPALQRLKRNTPVGPTGNLESAAAIKVKAYDKTGNAVGLLGYQRAAKRQSRSAAGGRVRKGPDRAFHQYWLELGTKDRIITRISRNAYVRKSHKRTTKSGTTVIVQTHDVKAGQGAVIASSFKSLGKFQLAQTQRQEEGQRVQTNPPYPGAYFKKAKKGQAIVIDGMTPGGTRGRPPLATTWEQSKTEVADILARELRISIETALQTLIQSATETVDV